MGTPMMQRESRAGGPKLGPRQDANKSKTPLWDLYRNKIMAESRRVHDTEEHKAAEPNSESTENAPLELARHGSRPMPGNHNRVLDSLQQNGLQDLRVIGVRQRTRPG